MRKVTCDGHGRHRPRTIFDRWKVFCRECEDGRQGYSVVEPDEMVFTLKFKGEEVTVGEARIGAHEAELTPAIKQGLVELGKAALGIRRKALAELRMGLAQAAPARE